MAHSCNKYALGDTVLSLEEVVALEQELAQSGASLFTLMSCAGAALAERAKAMAPEGRICILAGSGNNGGDGWVVEKLFVASLV